MYISRYEQMWRIGGTVSGVGGDTPGLVERVAEPSVAEESEDQGVRNS